MTNYGAKLHAVMPSKQSEQVKNFQDEGWQIFGLTKKKSVVLTHPGEEFPMIITHAYEDTKL